MPLLRNAAIPWACWCQNSILCDSWCSALYLTAEDLSWSPHGYSCVQPPPLSSCHIFLHMHPAIAVRFILHTEDNCK